VTWNGLDNLGMMATAPFYVARLELMLDGEVYASNEATIARLMSLPEAPGIYHFLGSDGADRDDWGRVHVIDAFVATGAAWTGTYRIGIGDLSRQNGGVFSPHATHQHGECADLRYVATDGETQLNLAYSSHRRRFDRAATQTLVDQLFAYGASEVLADQRSGLTGANVTFLTGHSDHFHVRFPLFPDQLGETPAEQPAEQPADQP